MAERTTALVVGGTGPTGPYIVDGLRRRGFTVTILHRGTHEIDEIPDDVEHIHADPHFRETLDPALDGRSWDVTVATYGRLRHVAEAMVGHTGQFVAVGGVGVYRGFFGTQGIWPPGLALSTPEDAPLVETEQENRFQYLMVQAERAALAAHPSGSLFRYPYVFGARQLIPREWSVVRRIRDGRPFVLLPEAGLTIITHGYVENLAHAVLLAVDQPDRSAGKFFNVGDDQQLTMAQVVAHIARHMDSSIEILSLPTAAAKVARPLTPLGSDHRLFDMTLARESLGYRDVVPVLEGLERTVDWLMANQPEHGGDTETRLGDPFDYRAEDRLAEILRRSIDEMSAVQITEIDSPNHAYAHPKRPGEVDHHGR